MAEFDDAWHDDWWARMEESGGNIIAAMRMRMVSVTDDCVTMEMPVAPACGRVRASSPRAR